MSAATATAPVSRRRKKRARNATLEAALASVKKRGKLDVELEATVIDNDAAANSVAVSTKDAAVIDTLKVRNPNEQPVALYAAFGYRSKAATLAGPALAASPSTDKKTSSELEELQSRAVEWVQRHCETLPEDFERGRRFGPYSGSSFNQRVIRAYAAGSLQLLPRFRKKKVSHGPALRRLCAQGFELEESERMLWLTEGNEDEAVQLLCD